MTELVFEKTSEEIYYEALGLAMDKLNKNNKN